MCEGKKTYLAMYDITLVVEDPDDMEQWSTIGKMLAIAFHVP